MKYMIDITVCRVFFGPRVIFFPKFPLHKVSSRFKFTNKQKKRQLYHVRLSFVYKYVFVKV